jgi:hypothetical protein
VRSQNVTKQTNYPSCVYLLNLLLISNQVPRRGDKRDAKRFPLLVRAVWKRSEISRMIGPVWMLSDPWRWREIFKFRVAGLFAPSLSCASVCRRHVRVWRICLGEERSGAHRSDDFRAFVRVFCPAEITMVCFPFAAILCFRVLVSKVCVLMINCVIVGSTISRLRCLILLFVCTLRLSNAVLFVCFVCGDNGG